MNKILAILRKEWHMAFAGNGIWLQIGLFATSMMALTFFAGHFFDAGRADLSTYFMWAPLCLIVFVPVMAANQWAGELASGTLDLVWAGPRSALDFGFAKWLALMGFGAIVIAFVLPLWAAISWLGTPDHGAIIAGLIGMVLLLGAVGALGLFASSFSGNASLAALLGILFCFVLSVPVFGPFVSIVPPNIAEALAAFSIPAHFAGFARGNVAMLDVFFFLSLSIFGVWASAQMICKHYLGGRGMFWLRLIGAMVLLVLGNLALPGFVGAWQIDMTAEKIYSLSPQGKSMLNAVKTPRIWTFYYSAALAAQYPDIRQFGAQVRQMLHTIEAQSNGKINVYERIVQPDSKSEDQAAAAGIIPLATDAGDALYFGLADETGARIARFDPSRAAVLEFDLLRQIPKNSTKEFIIRLSDQTDMAGRNWYVTGRKETAMYQTMARHFNISDQMVSAKDAPWILVHPHDFSSQDNADLAAHLLDDQKFSMIVLADPYRESAAKPGLNGLPGQGAVATSRLPKSIRDLGVQMAADQVVVDPVLAANMQMGGKTHSYPVWLKLRTSNVVLPGPLQSASQRGLVLASAGFVRVNPVPGWRFVPILTTSDQAKSVPTKIIAQNKAPDEIWAAADGAGRKILAGLLINAAGNKRILLITDTDFIADEFYGKHDPVFGWQEVLDNGRFLQMAIEILAGAPDLMFLPPKLTTNRPLVRIENMRAKKMEKLATAKRQFPARDAAQNLRQMQQEFRQKINWIERSILGMNVVLFPLCFVLFGLFRRQRAGKARG